MKKEEDISKLFEGKQDSLSEMPSSNVWDRLENKLDNRKTKQRKIFYLHTAAAASVVLLLGMITSLLVFNQSSSNNLTVAKHEGDVLTAMTDEEVAVRSHGEPIIMTHNEREKYTEANLNYKKLQRNSVNETGQLAEKRFFPFSDNSNRRSDSLIALNFSNKADNRKEAKNGFTDIPEPGKSADTKSVINFDEESNTFPGEPLVDEAGPIDADSKIEQEVDQQVDEEKEKQIESDDKIKGYFDTSTEIAEEEIASDGKIEDKADNREIDLVEAEQAELVETTVIGQGSISRSDDSAENLDVLSSAKKSNKNKNKGKAKAESSVAKSKDKKRQKESTPGVDSAPKIPSNIATTNTLDLDATRDQLDYTNMDGDISQQQDIRLFEWIIGEWKDETGSSTEKWFKTDQFTISGSGLFTINGETIFTEGMKIKKIDDYIYFITATDESGTKNFYRLISYDAQEAVFENPNLEFPNQVILQRLSDDDFLTIMQNQKPAEISTPKQNYFQNRNQISKERAYRNMKRVNE